MIMRKKLKKFTEGDPMCKLVAEKGEDGVTRHFVATPDGKRIPRIVWTRVYDGVYPDGKDSAPYVIMKVFVEIENSR